MDALFTEQLMLGLNSAQVRYILKVAVLFK
jgi:hypothetical protein